MTTAPSLLYLVHRIPYPPNKGDKIRSYNLLRFLAKRYRVHLGTFVDDDDDWQHTLSLREHCEDICAVRLNPRGARLRSLSAFVTGDAASVPYYKSRRLAAWVQQKIHREGVSRVVVFSSPMAQYVRENGTPLRKVIDFVDVDSEKWLEYSTRRRWPMSWLYRRESDRLLRFERDVAKSATANVFVTREEAELFRRRASDVERPIHSIINGVDTSYFSPERDYASPYAESSPVIVFTGMMDYWANVDAASWFATEIFSRVREELSNARFFIVGARPTRAVDELSKLPGVEVTGRVQDVRPYLAHASVAVAPMRVARGIQNKVLEAFAMEQPVVGTSAAMEGLDVPPELQHYVSDDASVMAEKVLELLGQRENARRIGNLARRWVTDHHDWKETLKPMEQLIEHGRDHGSI